ncbi:MAG: transposase [Flavonifractor plautii]
MTQFGSSKRLCCWAGLTPGNNESAGKKNLSAFHVREYISNLRWCKSPTQTVKDKASPTTCSNMNVLPNAGARNGPSLPLPE